MEMQTEIIRSLVDALKEIVDTLRPKAVEEGVYRCQVCGEVVRRMHCLEPVIVSMPSPHADGCPWQHAQGVLVATESRR